MRPTVDAGEEDNAVEPFPTRINPIDFTHADRKNPSPPSHYRLLFRVIFFLFFRIFYFEIYPEDEWVEYWRVYRNDW